MDVVYVRWVDSVVGGGEWEDSSTVINGRDTFCETVGFYYEHDSYITLVQTIGNTGDGEDAVLNWIVIPKSAIVELTVLKRYDDENNEQEGLENRKSVTKRTSTLERKDCSGEEEENA